MKSSARPDARFHPSLPKATRQRTEIRKRSFNQIAELYDEARPGYPEPLFDDLVKLSGIRKNGRILEIGPGPGQATLPLARRGYRILAVELGDRLAELLRKRAKRFPNVEVLTSAFEDWKPEPEAFDLVLAATSFHWIPQKIAFRRSAQILKPGGSLALLWNFREQPDNEFFRALRELYRRFAPHLADARTPEQRIERQVKKVVSSGLFGPVKAWRYPWQRSYTADEYLNLLATQSNHAILDPGVRTKLFKAIRKLIEQHGGSLISPAVAVLILAPRR